MRPISEDLGKRSLEWLLWRIPANMRNFLLAKMKLTRQAKISFSRWQQCLDHWNLDADTSEGKLVVLASEGKTLLFLFPTPWELQHHRRVKVGRELFMRIAWPMVKHHGIRPERWGRSSVVKHFQRTTCPWNWTWHSQSKSSTPANKAPVHSALGYSKPCSDSQ